MQTGYRWGCSGDADRDTDGYTVGDTDDGDTHRDTVRNTGGIQMGMQTEIIGQG